jgi:hypothetical protein
MADQHNSNIPALPNQVAEDIPDIKENLEFHKDALELILQAWSDSDNSSGKLDTTTGFSDGTYNYEFPTNGIDDHSVFMLGDSDTIIWMYLNAAPPGWKVLATGADTVLGVSGGTGDYNVDGGNPDTSATWTQPNHIHKWYNFVSGNDDQSYDSSGAGDPLTSSVSGDFGMVIAKATTAKVDADYYTTVAATVNTWRPSASVGKLFQLDTA